MAILISETTSNAASATIAVPIVITIAADAGFNSVIPALTAVFGASFRFMMPVSTPQNTVVYRLRDDPNNQDGPLGISFDTMSIILIVLLIPAMARLIGFV